MNAEGGLYRKQKRISRNGSQTRESNGGEYDKKKGIIFRDEKNLQMSSDKTLLPFCQYPKDIKVYTKSRELRSTLYLNLKNHCRGNKKGCKNIVQVIQSSSRYLPVYLLCWLFNAAHSCCINHSPIKHYLNSPTDPIIEECGETNDISKHGCSKHVHESTQCWLLR